MSFDAELSAGRVLELSVSCRELRDLDWFSKSDPFVVLFVGPEAAAQAPLHSFLGAQGDGQHHPLPSARKSLQKSDWWQYVGETEVVWNELSPSFVVKFLLPLDAPGIRAMPLRFEVYDMDKPGGPLTDQDFLGAYETSAAALADPRNAVCRATLADRRLRQKANLGEIVTASEVYDTTTQPHLITLQVCLAASCAVPAGEQVFYVLSRAASGGVAREPAWARLYRSGPVLRGGAGREWQFQDVVLSEDKLKAGERARALRMELFLHRRNGRHLRLGRAPDFTFQDLDRGDANGDARLEPDAESDAVVLNGMVAVTAQLYGNLPDEPESCAPMRLASAGSSVRSSLASLDASFIVFRFSNFLWSPRASRDSGFLKPMRGARAQQFSN